MKTDPFTSAGLIESEDRSARLVLEANQSHWNHERGPRLQRVVFRNDLTPAQALELCISTEGEMDIVTEVSPADAARVLNSQYAKLVECDANRVLVGILNPLMRMSRSPTSVFVRHSISPLTVRR